MCLGSNSSRMSQDQQLFLLHFFKGCDVPCSVEKFDFKNSGSVNLHDGAHLAANQPDGGFLHQQGDHIQQFDQLSFHVIQLAQSR